MTTYQFLWILFGHWIADFVFQSHWQASNKSKNWKALSEHVLTYTAIITAFCGFVIIDYRQLLIFSLITFATHFITDAITSRISAKLFGKDWHNFFVIVGLDQQIHFTTLAVTIIWLLK